MKRRDFFKLSADLGVGLLLPWEELVGTASAAPPGTLSLTSFLTRLLAQGMPLAGSAIPQFVDPLPLLSVAGGPLHTIIAGTNEIELHMREFQANVMPSTFVPATGPGTYTGTWVWGYIVGPSAPTAALGTYLGPVIVATRNQPTQIRFVNNLTTDHIFWRDWTDQTLHWADPLGGEANMCAHMGGIPTEECAEHYEGPVPAVPHLHGGEVPPVIDGGRMPGSPAMAPIMATRTTPREALLPTRPSTATQLHGGRANLVPRPPAGRQPPERLRRVGRRLPDHRPGLEPSDRPASRLTGPAPTGPRYKRENFATSATMRTPAASAS